MEVNSCVIVYSVSLYVNLHADLGKAALVKIISEVTALCTVVRKTTRTAKRAW